MTVLVEPLAGDAFVRLDVLLAGTSDHLRGQLGRGRLAVPAAGVQPIAHVLLIEALLRAPRRVTVRRPETRRVGRAHFVDQDEFALAESEFDLCVRDDDPAFQGYGRDPLVDGNGQFTEPFRETRADQLGALPQRDGHVVSFRGLRRRREDRLGQSGGFLKAGRKLDSAYRAGLLVLRPTRPGQVPARDAFHRDDLGTFHQHRATGEADLAVERLGEGLSLNGDDMIAHQIVSPFEPERTECREHPALVRNRAGQHHIESADPIRGNQQELVRPRGVDVSNLPAGVQPLGRPQLRRPRPAASPTSRTRRPDSAGTAADRRVPRARQGSELPGRRAPR